MKRKVLSNVMSGDKGFTLVEVIIVCALIGILVSIASLQMNSFLKHLKVRDCANKLASDIKYAGTAARTQGHRAQLLVTIATGGSDFNGDGRSELWLTFLDSWPDPNGRYDAGETVLSYSSCENVSLFDSNLTDCSAGAAVPNRCISFNTLGAVRLNANERNVILTNTTDNAYRVRVTILSLVGHIVMQACQVVGSEDCSAAGSGWNDI